MVVQISILEILQSAKVCVTTPWGEIVASWHGREAARVGETWLVELDTPAKIDWSDVAVDPAEPPGLAQLPRERARLTGTVALLDLPELLVIEFGGSSVTLEVARMPAYVAPGTKVAVDLDDLQLWPHDRI